MSGYSPFQPWSSASPYALALGIAALLCVLIGLVGWRRRAQPGGAYLALVMGASAWWALLYAFELTTPGLAGKIFWLKLQYMGVVGLPLAWLLFAWDYTGQFGRVNRAVRAGLCGMALLTVLLVVTNELHILMWSETSTSPIGAVVVEPGPWLWINLGYSYLLLAASSAMFLRMALSHPRLYRGQGVFLLSAIGITWTVNVVSMLWLVSTWVDVTPFAFVVTGLFLLLALTRGRLFSLPPVLVPLARMRALETMADPALALDIDGRVVLANPAAVAVFGGVEHNLVGRLVPEFLGEQSQELGTREGKGDQRFEISLDDNGGKRRFDVVASPLGLGGGGVGSLLIFRDVTERGETEKDLRRSEERFRAIFEQGLVGIAVLDENQWILRANPALCNMLGYEEHELVGRGIAHITAPVDRDRSREAVRRLFREEEFSLRMDKQYQRKDGSIFWGHVSAAALPGAHGQPTGAVSMVQDISEHRRAEEALRLSQSQLEAAMDLTDMVNWEMDIPTGLFTFNDRFYAMYGTTAEAEGGYEMPAEVYSRKFVHPEEAELVAMEVQVAIDTDDPEYRAYIEHRIVRADGEVRHIVVRYGITKDEQGRTIKTHGANQDITDRKRTEQALARAEEQLRQSQKMEAVGQLAGGIAHDFNNMLTAIIGNSDLALDTMAPDDPNRALVEDIRSVGDRAASLTRQILAFSRRQMLKPEIVCLNDVVKRMQPMLFRTLGESIRIETVLDPGLKHAEVDPHQMEQVVMNLAVNGRDAMPEGGRLLIETANVELERSYAMVDAELEPGSYVMLAVSDEGSGMDERTRSRIFEPFFTTKALGKGTGLGLSTVFGIVRQSGGSVVVDSEAGKGSTFRVYLPVSTKAQPHGAERSLHQEIAKGTEIVLVVEDEAPVRELVVRILRRAGYTTLEAGSAADVDAIMATRNPVLDLLLTDVGLPGGRTGREVAMDARTRQPDLPVIFMSGYTRDQSVVDGSVGGAAEFLEKPFAAEGLLGAVRTALDARAARRLQVRIDSPDL